MSYFISTVFAQNQPSNSRKHLLRHTKPYKCAIPECPKPDGFTTKNDLDRHQKSVHKITPANVSDKSYKCAACYNKDKIWPRLDNFRSHCNRLHKDLDVDELVRESVVPSTQYSLLRY